MKFWKCQCVPIFSLTINFNFVSAGGIIIQDLNSWQLGWSYLACPCVFFSFIRNKATGKLGLWFIIHYRLLPFKMSWFIGDGIYRGEQAVRNIPLVASLVYKGFFRKPHYLRVTWNTYLVRNQQINVHKIPNVMAKYPSNYLNRLYCGMHWTIKYFNFKLRIQHLITDIISYSFPHYEHILEYIAYEHLFTINSNLN